MIYGEPNDAMFEGYPPGHPAGTDEFISVGEVTSGRGMGRGGVLGTQGRATGAVTHSVEGPTDVAVSTGPTVLIAVDGSSISESVVRAAHRLFGDDATYLAINVSPGPYTELRWAYVWPVAGPSIWLPPTRGNGTADAGAVRAEAVTRDAGLAQATPLGDVGDPTRAIIVAAHHHRVDVVVIGADERGWLSRVVDGSVERELLREADFAVLVVPAAPEAAQQGVSSTA